MRFFTLFSAHAAFSLVSAAVADIPSRNINMHFPNGTVGPKYVDVPEAYTHDMVKHADMVGMHYKFNNNETWLTMDDKRLFKFYNYDHDDVEPAPESPGDFPVMSPSELQQALEGHMTYEEAHARFTEVWSARDSPHDLLSRDYATCRSAGCSEHYDCWGRGAAGGVCWSCTQSGCLWIEYPQHGWGFGSIVPPSN